MTFVSAIVRECNLLDLIPVECSCGKAVEKHNLWALEEMMLMFLKLVILLCYDWDDSWKW